MKILKVFFLFLATCNVFSYNILSKEEEEFALKYYSQEEIEKNDEWEFDLMFPKKMAEHNLQEFKMPHFKFYKNEKLTGEPIAYIDEKGLSINGKYECTNAYLEKRFLFLVVEKGDEKGVTREGNYNLYEFDVRRCPYFPLQTWGSVDNETRRITSRFTVINEKIGKFKMKDEDVYFDALEWIEKYNAEKSAKVILKNSLTPKDLEDIGDLLLGLRKVLEKGSMLEIYNYTIKDSPEKDPKILENSSVFVSVKTEFAVNRTLNSHEIERAIRSTLIANRRFSPDSDFNTNDNSRKIFLTFVEGDGRIYFRLVKYQGTWKIYSIDLFGSDKESTGC